jgi:hypothetical protein
MTRFLRLLSFISASLLTAYPVLASTLVVSNTNDNGLGSLRAALSSAASGDTIAFGFNFGTIKLVTPLTLTKNVSVNGPNTGFVIISGENSSRVLTINAGIAVTISWIAIQNGSSVLGGCVLNGGTLTLAHSSVSACKIGNQLGGGITVLPTGTLNLNNTTVTNNFAGPWDYSLQMGGTAIVKSPELGVGGGIFNYLGIVNLTNSVISQNFTFGPTAGSTQGGGGGGIFNFGGTVNLNNSSVSENASSVGAGIENDFGTLTIFDSTIANNLAAGTGGGIENETNGTLSLSNSTVWHNGALSSDSAVLLDLGTPPNNSGGGNQCPGPGCIPRVLGSISLKSQQNRDASGSAIPGAVDRAATGVVATLAPAAAGGGIKNVGMAAVSNATISANYSGGGMSNYDGSLVTKNSLFANNTQGNCSVGTFSSGSIASAGHNLSDDATCSSFFVQPGDQNGISAGLDPTGLQSNGGSTQTAAILVSSPGVNAVPVSSCSDVNGIRIATDQRGVVRPQGAACDIGAFEYVSPRPVHAPPLPGNPKARP